MCDGFTVFRCWGSNLTWKEGTQSNSKFGTNTTQLLQSFTQRFTLKTLQNSLHFSTDIKIIHHPNGARHKPLRPKQVPERKSLAIFFLVIQRSEIPLHTNVSPSYLINKRVSDQIAHVNYPWSFESVQYLSWYWWYNIIQGELWNHICLNAVAPFPAPRKP